MIAFTLCRVTNGATDVPTTRSPAEPHLTPGEALVKLFLDNADRAANADNDSLVVELLKRRREIQTLANLTGPGGTTTVS
ncbi:MAG: hypothetical protein ACRDTX_05815 [Pseudonocardiaceae bacterium]